MSSSAGPSRVRRPRRSSALTSNGKTLSSTGTAEGARTGASVFVAGDWETMALYLGSVIAKRKGLLMSSPRTQGPITTGLICVHRVSTTSFQLVDHAVWVPARASLGRDDSFGCSRHCVETPGQNALLRVEAVFGLVEH